MNKELLNGSGCPDPTAFKAIANIESFFRRNDMGTKWFAEGDVVKYESTYGSERCVLLKCHAGYSTAIKLYDSKPDENAHEVVGKSKAWIDVGKLMWVADRKVVSMERSLTDAEFSDLKNAVAAALGLESKSGGGGSGSSWKQGCCRERSYQY